ncbi:MAG: hypothetical protein U0575_10995 [Phycisphaerales bacterium]
MKASSGAVTGSSRPGARTPASADSTTSPGIPRACAAAAASSAFMTLCSPASGSRNVARPHGALSLAVTEPGRISSTWAKKSAPGSRSEQVSARARQSRSMRAASGASALTTATAEGSSPAKSIALASAYASIEPW